MVQFNQFATINDLPNHLNIIFLSIQSELQDLKCQINFLQNDNIILCNYIEYLKECSRNNIKSVSLEEFKQGIK